jgi:hypothetical protein
MQIRYQETYSSRVTQIEIGTLIERTCDGHDYGTGALEAASRAASNAGAMLGRLIDLLVSRGNLSAQDVLDLAESGASDPELVCLTALQVQAEPLDPCQ